MAPFRCSTSLALRNHEPSAHADWPFGDGLTGIRFVDPESGRDLGRLEMPEPVKRVEFGPTGRWLIATTPDGIVRAINLRAMRRGIEQAGLKWNLSF